MPVTKKTKGELTRERIIEATLDLIAESGLQAVTYRNVAKKADIRHSLTTYHFGNIETLICEAFEVFERKERTYYEKLKSRSQEIAVAFKASNDPLKSVDQLATALVDYIDSSNSGERKKQVTIESEFVFSLNATEEVSKRVRKYNDHLLLQVRETMDIIGSPSPEADANIMLASIRYFELANATGHVASDRDLLKKTFIRQLSILIPNK